MHVVTGSSKVGVLFVSHKASAKFVPKQKFLMLKIGINHATVVSSPPQFYIISIVLFSPTAPRKDLFLQ